MENIKKNFFRKFEKQVSFKFIFRKLNFGILVKNLFLISFRFLFFYFFLFFLLIGYFMCLSMQHCFKRLIYILINTFHIFYIKSNPINIIFFLFFSEFSRICLFFTSSGVWSTDLVLKLSKSFNKNRARYTATQSKFEKMF